MTIEELSWAVLSAGLTSGRPSLVHRSRDMMAMVYTGQVWQVLVWLVTLGSAGWDNRSVTLRVVFWSSLVVTLCYLGTGYTRMGKHRCCNRISFSIGSG